MDLVTIARFRDLLDAQLAAGKLRSEDIPVFVEDKYLVGIQWLYSIAIGGVRLRVPHEHAETARTVLDTDDSNLVAELMAEGDPDACQSCDSTNLRYTKLRRRSAALTVLLAPLPILFWGTRVRCRVCGHSWTPARNPEPLPDIPAAGEPAGSPEGTRSWRDDRWVALLLLMALICIYMLNEYTKTTPPG